MNQKQFIEKGKGSLPVTILKWIWKNLDKIDDIIALLQSLRKVKTFDNEPTECPLPKPSYHPTPNGEWRCVDGAWQWIEDLG